MSNFEMVDLLKSGNVAAVINHLEAEIAEYASYMEELEQAYKGFVPTDTEEVPF